MSGFVPLQKSSSFQAGVISSGETGSAPRDQSVREPAATDVAEEGGELDEGPALPASIEELEAMLSEARESARADAEAAMVSVRESLEAERQQVAALCQKVVDARISWTNEVRNVLGELVVVGVRQVVSESADLQAQLIRDRLAEVGERLLGEQHVILRVRPEDEELAKSVVGEREGWQIIADSDLSGGVLAETEGGKVDATLGAALTGLAESVQGWQAEGIGEE